MTRKELRRLGDAELQDLADLAHTFQLIHSAKLYGLIVGGGSIQVDRCEEALAEAKRRGIAPRDDAVERLMPILSARTAEVQKPGRA